MPDLDCCVGDLGMCQCEIIDEFRKNVRGYAIAGFDKMPTISVTITPESLGKCPDCLGDGVVPIVDGHADDLVDCKRCLGYGFASYGEPTDDIDDADHAEYVDPIDHSHDVAISSEAAVARLAAVLDIHRRTEDHVCAAEPHIVFPCPTARAALGVK